MSFKQDILIFLTNTLNKLENIELVVKTQKEKIKILETKIEEYELEKEKLEKADKILEEARNNADNILMKAINKVDKQKK